MKRTLVLVLIVLALLLSSCELSYERHRPAPEIGTVRILVYGNDYHTKPDVYWGAAKVGTASMLQGTVNDAVQIGYALTSLAKKADLEVECTYILGSSDMSLVGAEILAFDPAATVISDTTVTSLVHALENLRLAAQSNDMTFVFYAGHGDGLKKIVQYDEDVISQSYLVLSTENPSRATYFPEKSFLDAVDAIDGIKFILGDFCHSGALVRKGNISIGDREYAEIGIGTLFREYCGDINESPSTFCLTAARYYESSYESNKDIHHHGYFTNAILRAIGWNEEEKCIGEIKVLDAKGRLTLLNLANYVILNDGKSAQTPMVSGGSNDIVLFAF